MRSFESGPEESPQSRQLVFRRSRADRVFVTVLAAAALPLTVVVFLSDMPTFLGWLSMAMLVIFGIGAYVVWKVEVRVDEDQIEVRRSLGTFRMFWHEVDAYYDTDQSRHLGFVVLGAVAAFFAVIHLAVESVRILAVGNLSGAVIVLEDVHGRRLGVPGQLVQSGKGGESLAALVRAQAIRRVESNLRALFDSGVPVPFGPFSIGRVDGLTKGGKVLRPEELAGYSMRLARGTATVSRKGSVKRFAAVPVGKVPNRAVLSELFEELKESVVVT